MSNFGFGSDIPEEFWSEYSDQPFETCVECETPLRNQVTPYVVQKSFVAGEAVFEMAICLQCATRLNESFSSESRQAIVDFVQDAPERLRRQEEAQDDEPIDLEDIGDEDEFDRAYEAIEARSLVRREQAMAACALCAKPKGDCHRYSLGSACLGVSLITAAPEMDNLGSPFLICEDCERQMSECISQKTRDSWDRFVEDNFDGPPELAVDPRELVALF